MNERPETQHRQYFSSRPVLDATTDIRLICRINRGFLLLSAAISGIISAAWLLPGLGEAISGNWQAMKFDAACALLLLALQAYLLHRPSSGALWIIIKALLMGAVTLIMLHSLQLKLAPLNSEALYFWQFTPFTRESSNQSLLVIITLQILIVTLYFPVKLKRLSEILILGLSVFLLVMINSYIFHVEAIYASKEGFYLPLATYICSSGVLAAISSPCLREGFFSHFMEDGMSGRIYRTIVPILILLPMILGLVSNAMRLLLSLQPELALAIGSTIMSILAIAITTILAREVQKLENTLENTAISDYLTGLNNLRGFHILAEQRIQLSLREGGGLTVYLFDLDMLKYVNDTYGHDAGSQYIVDFATALTRTFRGSDICARIGGDEFVVLAPKSNPEVIIKRLEWSIKIICSEPRHLPVKYSYGWSFKDPVEDHSQLDTMIADADAKLYKLKAEHRKNNQM